MTKPRASTKAAKGEVVEGSHNVFADLGLLEAEEALTKAELARRISEIIVGNKMTQARAALALGIDQPKVSALVRGRLDGFSTDRLVKFLNALGRDVDIVVRRARGVSKGGGVRAGRTRVVGRP